LHGTVSGGVTTTVAAEAFRLTAQKKTAAPKIESAVRRHTKDIISILLYLQIFVLVLRLGSCYTWGRAHERLAATLAPERNQRNGTIGL
jgi:hypothetical protein